MKKMMFASLAVSMISMNAMAQVAASTSQEVAAQTTITRGKIDNLLEKVNRRQLDSKFNARDYEDQSQAYKNKVESALTKFESDLDKNVLSKASYWVDQYNSIYNSKDYSVDQKNMLLAQRKLNLVKQFEKISQDYQQAIKDVYNLVPYYSAGKAGANPAVKSYDKETDMVQEVSLELVLSDKVKASSKFYVDIETEGSFKNKTSKMIIKKNKKEVLNSFSLYNYSSEEGLSVDQSQSSKRFYFVRVDFNFMAKKYNLLDGLTSEAYKNYIYPAIKGSCKSSICVGLRASDYSTLAIMIKSLIDRDMDIKLADGSWVKVTKLNQDITSISELLSRVDYPEDLPFDI